MGVRWYNVYIRQETVLFCCLSCLQAASTSYHRHEAALPLSFIFSIKGLGVNNKGRGGGFDEISGAVMMTVRHGSDLRDIRVHKLFLNMWRE